MDTNKKKVNIVSQFWPPSFVGGGEISTYIIGKELAKKGYIISVLTPNIPKEKDPDFHFIQLHNPSNFLLPFEKVYFSKIYSFEPPPDGIYWASDFYGAGYLCNKNVNKIATIRDYWPVNSCGDALTKNLTFCYEHDLKSILNCKKVYESSYALKLFRVIKYLHNSSFRRNALYTFDDIIFISNYIKNAIVSSIDIDNYSVIYNALPIKYDNTITDSKRVQYNILFAGAIIKHKGPSVIINALTRVIEKYPKITLTFAGEVYEEYIESLSKMRVLKNIRVVGKISPDKLMTYYDSSDIIINSSLRPEPFGRSIIEGMARECVPIASDDGGPSEIIKDKKTGFLFEKGNYHQLAAIIVDLYKNPTMMRQVQKNARNYSIRHFSLERIVQKYEQIFNNY